MAYTFTPEQLQVAHQALRSPLYQQAGPKVRLALAEAGLTESNFRNLPTGSNLDSAGYLQQRPSQGWGTVAQVENPTYATTQFLKQALQLRGKYGDAGSLAQAVQRSAYPERYAAHAAEAKALLAELGMGHLAAGSTSPAKSQPGPGPGEEAPVQAILQALARSQQPPQPTVGQIGRPALLGGEAPSLVPKPVQSVEAPQTGLQTALTTLLSTPQGQGAVAQAEAKTATTGAAGQAGLGAKGAVAFAVKSLGRYAESEGNNLGPELNALEAKFGLKGAPWCAVFASTAAAQGGASKAVRTASVANINEWAAQGSHGYAKGLLAGSQAQPGDLMTFGDAHVAFVKERRGNTIVTIEGNADGSGGVVQRTRSVSEGRIARPRY